MGYDPDMFLRKLIFTNYRNFSELDLSLEQTTLLIGKNAQGKSNLLEAIYFLATTKSAKADRDVQLIKQEESVLRVEGDIENDDASITHLEIAMQTTETGLQKRVSVNGVPRRVTDYIGNLVVVMFTPEDINLVVGPPALRRWHVDLTLAQVDREYKRALTEYSEVITSRNRVLKRIKEGLSRLDELDFWNERALASAQIVTQKRTDFFESINTFKLLGNFSFIYQPSPLSSDRMREYISREIAAATSLIGPHRDDFIFKLEGQDLSYFGSRGEQRTAVLELKLSEVNFINNLQGSRPILLLDDVLSELDDEHRALIFSIVPFQQTVISAVENEVINEEFLASAKVIKVSKGSVLKA